MIKVLFVCMGNICRSPTAHGIFDKLITEKQLLEHFEVDSAGTHAYHEGYKPDERAQLTAKKYGVELDGLVARVVTNSDFKEFDYIIAMDAMNYKNLSELCPKQYLHKLDLLLNYNTEVSDKDVPDPYYGGKDGFDKVYKLIAVAVDNLLQELQKKHNV